MYILHLFYKCLFGFCNFNYLTSLARSSKLLISFKCCCLYFVTFFILLCKYAIFLLNCLTLCSLRFIVSSFSCRARYYLFSFQLDLRCDIHFWNICSLAVICVDFAVCCLQNLHWGIAIQIHRRVVFRYLIQSTWDIYRFSF